MREFKLKKIINVVLLLLISFYGCERNVEEGPNDITSDCSNVEAYYDENVTPILSSHCLGCHSGQTLSGGLSLDSYTSVYAANKSGDVLDRVNSNEGDIGFMPDGGTKLSDANLEILQIFFDMECNE